MDNHDVAQRILEEVGGKENISSLTHCFTRLRFVLKDKSKANKEVISNLEGVIQVVEASGQFQIVLGNKVEKIYDELMPMVGELEETNNDDGEKVGIGTKILNTVAAIFTPTVPAIAASGMLKGILAVAALIGLNMYGVDIKTYNTYIILNAASDALFYFMPIILARSAAKVFKTNDYIAMILGATLCYPAIVDLMTGENPVTLFGIGITQANYVSSVVPIIIAVFVLAYVEGFVKKIMPEVLKVIMVPTLSLLVMVPATLMIFGPIGIYFGNVVNWAYYYIMGLSPILLGAFIGGIWCVLVIFGAHRAIIPIGINDVAKTGRQNLLAFAGAAKDNDTTFDAVTSPSIDHYTANKEIVAEVTGVKLEDEDTEVTVTYTAQSETTTETKEVKQTIHYVYEDGKEAAPDKLDSVTFIRTVTTNEATGEVTYGEWTAKDDDTTFDEVKSPEIDNYTADKELIGEVTDLTGESKDNEVTVTYVPKIEERIETKEINRVIHYVYENTKEAAPDKTDTVTFTRIMTKNLATGEVTYGEWTAADDDTTFDEVKSPKIDGYVADKKVIDKVTDLEVDDKDVEETVTYRKIASAPSSEEPSDSTKTSTTETTGSTTVSSESKSQTTTAVSKSSGGTTHQAAVTTKTTTSTKTLPSTGEKVRHYLTWFGGLAVAAAAIFGVLVNRSKRKIK